MDGSSIFQVWPQEDHASLFRVEGRCPTDVDVQSQLSALRHRSLPHRSVWFRDVFAGLRSRYVVITIGLRLACCFGCS